MWDHAENRIARRHRLRIANADYRNATEDTIEQASRDVEDAIIRAHRAEISVSEIMRLTGRTRYNINKIIKAADVTTDLTGSGR